eukprot:Colp12_sorted_trinity150504_noHs@29104
MGCNQSTAKDVKESRQRGQSKAQPAASSTPTKPIARLAPGVASENEDNLGTSYTDKRVGEQDFFKEIISRTAENFIDVSQASAPATIGTKEAAEKEQGYKELIKTATVDTKKLRDLFSLPVPASGADPVAVLSAPTALTKQEADSLASACAALSSAIIGFEVKGVSNLVATLPDIQ